MAARSPPQSAINNILDFLMFFNSGKTCPVTHEFISSKVIGASDQISRRYNDFYILSAFVASEENWDQTSLGDLLASIVDLEKTYNHVGLQHKWFVTKLDIIFQIGLSILRDMIELDGNLPNDLSEFSIPSQIPVGAYRSKIQELREKYEAYYIVEETGDLHAKYAQHLELLVDGVLDTKKPKRGPVKSVLNKEKVYDLLDEHRVSAFTEHVVKFIQSVEEKALHIPLDVGCYTTGAGESLGSTLRRLSKQHQPDWTDAEAEAHGPYASSSARKTRSVAEVEVAPEVVEASASTSSKGAAASTTASSASSSKAPKEAVAEPPTTRSGRASAVKPVAPKSPEIASSPPPSPKIGTRRSKKSVAPEPEAGSITALQQNLKRKYDETDPLAEFLVNRSPAAKARVSREAELSVFAKKSAPGSGSAAKPAAGKSAGKGKPASFTSAGRAKKGESIDFSESESESIDEESDFAGSDEGRGSSRAVAQLLGMKKNHPQANSKFPAKLETPTKGKGAKKVSVAAERANAIASGKRIKWNLAEELVLEEAVERYGEGNWASILEDPEYGQTFVGRTNVNLKDKWRNLLKIKAPN